MIEKNIAHSIINDMALRDLPMALRDLPMARVMHHEMFDVLPPISVQRPPRLRDQHATGQCWLYSGVAFLETVVESVGTDRYIDVVFLYKQFLVTLVTWVSERLSDPSLDERTRQILLDTGIDDGGSWNTFLWIATQPGNLRTFPRRRREWPIASQNSNDLRDLLRAHVRNGVSVEDMTRTIHSFLPDVTGDVRIHDDVAQATSDYFQLVNASHLKPNRWYANYFDPTGTDAACNVSMKDLMHACRVMLQQGRAVWITACINYDFDWARLQAHHDATPPSWTNIPPRTRTQRIAVRDLRPDHAMLLIGCENGRWRIRNSWGERFDERYAEKAIFDDDDDSHDIVATDEWFAMNVFHAVVHTQVVKKPSGHDSPPEVLPPWDILSTVAHASFFPRPTG